MPHPEATMRLQSMMTSHSTILLSFPTIGWSVELARVEGMARVVDTVTKRNRYCARGCFHQTD